MRYKYSAAKGWFWQIDELDNKTEFNQKNRPKMYEEMQAWVAKGNEIEPIYNEEELAAKELKEDEQALESQKSTCIQNLKDTDYKLLEDFEFPEDLEKVKADRVEWKRIAKSNKLETIPEK